MTSYNREKYISESIESVLSQTYVHFELIIVDDCSQDDTVKIAQYYQQKDQRISVYINNKNLGDYQNRQKATTYASGDFIMFVDSDDSIVEDALEYIVNAFDQYPNAQHSSIYYEKDIKNVYLMSSKEAINNHFFKNNMLACGPGARVFRNSFFTEMGGYPIIYGPANDSFFNIKTVASKPILLLPYVYLYYRIHDLQENKNKFSYLYNGFNYFRDAMELTGLPIDKDKIAFLSKKNKRRFIFNSLKFFMSTLNFSLTLKAYKLTYFSFSDFKEGVFGKKL